MNLGLAYEYNKNKPQAKICYEKALAVAINDQQRREALKRLNKFK